MTRCVPKHVAASNKGKIMMLKVEEFCKIEYLNFKETLKNQTVIVDLKRAYSALSCHMEPHCLALLETGLRSAMLWAEQELLPACLLALNVAQRMRQVGVDMARA